ncbi:MAG: rod shape-determining protein MreC [Candidatus Kapabacteria bacterium]|nr:rod shape-determining protein MreC [Candidatus Kapabacteria bacterium]
MRGFIEFVVRFKNYITLITLVVMSLSLMSIGNLSKLGGFRAVIVGSIGWIQSVFSWIPNPVALKAENTALRELNLQLAVEAARSRQSMLENSTLRSMLKLPALTEHRLIAADVIGKTTTQQRNYATINKGQADGVREGMSVISDAGLVGIVIGTSEHFAVLQLLINRDTRVSAKVQRTRVDGIIQWEGENILVLKNVPRTLDVREGDRILTSNYSPRYPANLVIGTVRQATDEANTLFRRIVVDPAVNFSTLEQVFVVDAKPDPERSSLERIIDEQVPNRSTP